MSKPKIIWLCDVKGWAYDNRAQQLSRLLHEYDHEVIYWTEYAGADLTSKLETADMIVVMHPSAFKFVPDGKKSIAMLTGHRGLAIPRCVLYYTDNSITGSKLDILVRGQILEAIGDLPLISVSQQPMEFGRNIVSGPKPRCVRSILEQNLLGLSQIPADAYVYLVEHDCLYHPSHFDAGLIKGSLKSQINYNENYYRCTEGGYAYHRPSRRILSQCSGLAGTLFAAFSEKLYLLNQGGRAAIGCLEPGRGFGCTWATIKTYQSEIPSVDIRHGGCFSKQQEFPVDCQTIIHWGDCKKLREGLGI